VRINQLTIKDFRNLRLVQMDDIPDLVVLAGANGSGKTAVLDAIVLAKEAVGRYYRPRVADAQINAAADFAEIGMTIATSEAERSSQVLHGQEHLSGEAHCNVQLTRAARLEVPTRPPGLSALFSTYTRRDAPEIGVVEYFRSTRSLPIGPIRSYEPEVMNEQGLKNTATSYAHNRFAQVKEYMAGLALAAAQRVEKRILVNR